MISIPSLLLGAVLGALAGTWFRYYIARPKLAAVGSGSGGGPGPGFHLTRLSLSNRPGLFGLRIPATVLFGFRVHRDMEFGLVVERNPARKCHAHIVDKESGQFVQHLWWRGRDGAMTRTVDIDSGETADLMLFARLDAEKSKYFIFDATSEHDPTPRVPADDVKLGDTREFTIEIRHSYGKKRFRVTAKVTKRFDGRLDWGYESGRKGGRSTF